MASNMNSSPSSPTEVDQGLDLSESMVSSEESTQSHRKRRVLPNIEPDIKKLKLNYCTELITSVEYTGVRIIPICSMNKILLFQCEHLNVRGVQTYATQNSRKFDFPPFVTFWPFCIQKGWSITD